MDLVQHSNNAIALYYTFLFLFLGLELSHIWFKLGLIIFYTISKFDTNSSQN